MKLLGRSGATEARRPQLQKSAWLRFWHTLDQALRPSRRCLDEHRLEALRLSLWGVVFGIASQKTRLRPMRGSPGECEDRFDGAWERPKLVETGRSSGRSQ